MIRVFVSFDLENDAELYEQLLADSQKPGSSFEISSGSRHVSANDDHGERMRSRIRDSDQMIVICGEHTEDSVCMKSELRIAQEEKTPYFLLWGRRDSMCTKPFGAKNSDGMYSWTRQILQNQLAVTRRSLRRDLEADRAAAAKNGSTGARSPRS